MRIYKFQCLFVNKLCHVPHGAHTAHEVQGANVPHGTHGSLMAYGVHGDHGPHMTYVTHGTYLVTLCQSQGVGFANMWFIIVHCQPCVHCQAGRH